MSNEKEEKPEEVVFEQEFGPHFYKASLGTPERIKKMKQLTDFLVENAQIVRKPKEGLNENFDGSQT